MKDLREEVGTKACIVGNMVKSRMKWAGHIIRMKAERLPKRSETNKKEGCRKRGRSQLRREDCLKRDPRKAEEEERLREKANDKDQWKQITKVAIQQSDNETNLTPAKGKPQEEQKNALYYSNKYCARICDKTDLKLSDRMFTILFTMHFVEHNLFYNKKCVNRQLNVGLVVAQICQHPFHLHVKGSDSGCIGWSTIIDITMCHIV